MPTATIPHGFSPRKRRCFSRSSCASSPRRVFSAQAEVFLFALDGVEFENGFLRASGGVSTLEGRKTKRLLFSPRKRRCFYPLSLFKIVFSVFSAQAEVFLAVVARIYSKYCFLRASGGVSRLPGDGRAVRGFSPRKRRCFFGRASIVWTSTVFSAQAEVFLCNARHDEEDASFLRASGGVSSFFSCLFSLRWFSPRKRRCFYGFKYSSDVQEVFSAQAEVFLSHPHYPQIATCFLRASGGVSRPPSAAQSPQRFSPRKRRCF